MKLIFKFSAFILMFSIIIFISCKKEYSYEGCGEKNKPPIAEAGLYQVITLPTDSVLLDGNSSSDPDGKISEWLWTKISGPISFNVIRSSDSITKVKTLVAGTYQFELKVTDHCGLFAKDTVRIIVDSGLPSNHAPIANAGPDTTITLPNNIINLDGSRSFDPENNITNYVWTKISGSLSAIVNPNTVQTQVTNLVHGTYQFELKVTDAGGLFSKDTIQITINPELPVSTACNIGNRPLINAQLIPVGTLSHWRENITIASANNKILIAGGSEFTENPGYLYSTVDIYDIVTNSWSTSSLSQQKHGMGVAVLGNRIFFAGGGANLSGNDRIDFSLISKTSRIDIYDASNNTWSIDSLSIARYPTGASVNNKVLFAGGDIVSTNPEASRVDIYDASSNSWSIAELSLGRVISAATTTGGNVYFAGGYFGSSGITGIIDIYNTNSNSWSVSNFNPPFDNWGPSGISVENKNYWAGGSYRMPNSNIILSTNHVEIRDMAAQTSTYDCLFQPNGGCGVVLKNDKIVFFTGSGTEKNKFDIYNITNNTWSIGVLPVTVAEASIISVNNIIYVAGGFINGIASNQVWKLEF